MDVVVTIGLVVLLTAALLAFSGWRRGRPELPGLSGDPRHEGAGRPAGPDADSMASPYRRLGRRRRG
ncbi:MAG TPA: hypothetical protein VKB57_13680 [Acidimicrobiales bacterium]|nr:hypothetical protein [Acidimicrobiales bacterium]